MSQLRTKAFEDSSITSVKIGASEVATSDIAADAVTGAKIRLDNEQYIRARNAANSADVNLIKLDSADEMISNQNLNFGTSGGPAKVQNSAATYLMEVQSIDTSAATTHSGAVSIVSGDASGATSNSGNVTIQSGTATGTRGNVVLNGLDVNATAAGDINLTATDDIIGLGDVFDINAMSMLRIPVAASDPTGTAEGQMYYNSTSDVIKVWDGAAWDILSTGSTITGNKETFTLVAGDITNQYVDLANVALTGSIHFIVKGLGPLLEGASHDYSVSYTGGAGGNTRISFLNDIATGGGSALIATDVVQVVYSY